MPGCGLEFSFQAYSSYGEGSEAGGHATRPLIRTAGGARTAVPQSREGFLASCPAMFGDPAIAGKLLTPVAQLHFPTIAGVGFNTALPLDGTLFFANIVVARLATSLRLNEEVCTMFRGLLACGRHVCRCIPTTSWSSPGKHTLHTGVFCPLTLSPAVHEGHQKEGMAFLRIPGPVGRIRVLGSIIAADTIQSLPTENVGIIEGSSAGSNLLLKKCFIIVQTGILSLLTRRHERRRR